MNWESDGQKPPETTPATPAGPPPSFDQLQQAQAAYDAAEERERDQLENALEAIDDERRRQVSGWISDLLPWIGFGLVGGLATGFFTRRKRSEKR